jgi:methylase of polypeptide subunit release factors
MGNGTVMSATATPAAIVGGDPPSRTSRFGGLTITWDERVLRPRAWTARQSAWAAELLHGAPAGPVLELCCGAGHIGLLAVVASQRRLVAVDADATACDFARRNARAAGIAARVEVRHADLSSAIGPEERFALVLADPPYLPSREVGRYPADPTTAIDGGPDGMALVWPCLEVASEHLAPRGQVLLQLRSAEQGRRVADALDATGDLQVLELRNLGRGVVARVARS